MVVLEYETDNEIIYMKVFILIDNFICLSTIKIQCFSVFHVQQYSYFVIKNVEGIEIVL